MMTVNQFLGLNRLDTDKTGKRWSHTKKYSALVRALISFSEEELTAALTKDKYLNRGLPRPFSWDVASGFRCDGLSGVYRCHFIGSPLIKLYEEVGIYSYSVADGVCTLKQCVKMLVKQNDITT